MKKYILFFFLFAFFLFSCGPNYILDEKKEITNNQWNYSDSLSFTVNISDTNRYYNLYLDIEHLTEYSFKNMYIRLHSIFPSGKRVTERISLELIGFGGIWNGDCNSDECDFRMSIHENAFFNQNGIHTFIIEQFMRKDPLEGIQSVAFRIEDTGKSRE
jgi:gliding motility-associated lipoprotein GldH